MLRMIHTLLGAEAFRKGSDLYFERHDGQAVTCDDFVKAMQDASGVDLTRFKRIEPDTSLKNGRKTLIGYVGIMGAQDGVDLLIDAMEHPEKPEYHLELSES